jgi:hypothetical protein
MYNCDVPSRAELPSSQQLIRSTVIAFVSAVALLYSVVLPSEYGVDPTGIGHTLGLTEMGMIKTRLAKEAAEDAAGTLALNSELAASAPAEKSSAAPPEVSPSAYKAAPQSRPELSSPAWRDEMTFTLTPSQGTEIKMKMKQGEKALYMWSVKGGVVNFDTHGDAIGRSVSYEKGRGVASDQGELVAAFTGNHGWFWRNRGEADVTVILRTRGDYSDLKRVK